MRPNRKFQRQPKSFWASVRSLSQEIGYVQRTGRKKGEDGRLFVPSLEQMAKAFAKLELNKHDVLTAEGEPTKLGGLLQEYFEFRAEVLIKHVEPHLMDGAKARQVFERLKEELCPQCPIPMNKQTGEKKTPAYLTGIVNMLIEQNSAGFQCDFNPQKLTTVTKEGKPVRTLARRVDGAFPRSVNPIAVWEIKEYYYTTTFGSRVAGGVYETLLDGLELEELREHEQIDVKHYLMIDAHFTWWKKGKSYLCRMVDMLHMGYVDEVLFGYEVVEELPRIVKEWVKLEKQR